MNVIRSLVAFFVVVVVVAGVCFSSAAAKQNAFDGESGRLERRNLQTFQTQIATLFKPLDISDTSACKSAQACPTAQDPRYCNYLSDATFVGVFKIITDCYVQGICGSNFVTNTLPDVNISLPTPDNYNGQCYLLGPLTLTFGFDSITSAQPIDVAFYFNETIKYTFTGLTVHCQPCPTPPPPPKPTPCPGDNNNHQSGSGSGGGGGNCCNDLVSQLLCLVENLLSFLSIQLVECDCSCPDKRAAPESPGAAARELSQRQAAAAAFDGAVTAALSISFTSFYYLDSNAPRFLTINGNNKASTTASLGVEVPNAYQADLVAGIQGVFNDYNVYYPLMVYFDTVTTNLLINFYGYCRALPDA